MDILKPGSGEQDTPEADTHEYDTPLVGDAGDYVSFTHGIANNFHRLVENLKASGDDKDIIELAEIEDDKDGSKVLRCLRYLRVRAYDRIEVDDPDEDGRTKYKVYVVGGLLAAFTGATILGAIKVAKSASDKERHKS